MEKCGLLSLINYLCYPPPIFRAMVYPFWVLHDPKYLLSNSAVIRDFSFQNSPENLDPYKKDLDFWVVLEIIPIALDEFRCKLRDDFA